MKGWVIFFVALAIYGVSVFGEFVQDDFVVIKTAPDMGSVSALGAVFTRPYYFMNEGGGSGAYRPITSLSFYLNTLLTGKEPWGFRLVNILLYAGVCVLVFELLKKYTTTKMAFWGTIVFTVLPIHTEAVNNIVGRAEILSLGLFLLAVLAQMRSRWELSAILFLLALLTKEIAIVGLPILICILIWGRENKDTKRGVVFFYILVTGCYLILRTMVLGNESMGNEATIVENPLKFLPTNQRVMNAFSLVPFGVGKMIFPWHLSYDYSFSQIKLATSWFDIRVLLGISMSLLSIGSLLTKLRKNKLWIMGQALFWGSLMVTGNFLFAVGTIFGERLWFWTSLGMVLMITSLFPFRSNSLLATDNLSLPASDNHLDSRLEFPLRGTKQFKSAKRGTKNKNFKEQFLVIIIMMLAGRSFVRNLDWLSQERLFIHDANYVTGSVMAQTNKAAMLLINNDFEGGNLALEKAEKIYPNYPMLINNRGAYYLHLEEYDKAREKFEECLRVNPRFSFCESNLMLVKINKD